MNIPSYDARKLSGPDEDRHEIGHEDGQTCNRCPEPDADAALKVARAQGRFEGLREAAEIAGVKPRKGGKSVSGPHHAGIRNGRDEAKRLILALIEKEST